MQGSLFRAMYRAVMPKSAQALINRFRPGTLHRILAYHRRGHDRDSFATELDYLRRNGLAIFPYGFTSEHNAASIKVLRNEASDLLYVLHNGRSMYFPSDMDEQAVRTYYSQILIEQDSASPHRYLTDGFRPDDGDVIADIGAAEGVFCLENIDRASHCYMFEPEKRWIGCLRQTFRPWADKVTIVQGFVSDREGNGTMSVDSYFKGRDVGFLKVDAEGDEPRILVGAESSLRKKVRRAAVCSYHKHDHYEALSSRLAEAGFTVSSSEGWILFLHDPVQKPPFFRHALIRAERLAGRRS